MLDAVSRLLRRMKDDHVLAVGLALLVVFGGVGSVAWRRLRTPEPPACDWCEVGFFCHRHPYAIR